MAVDPADATDVLVTHTDRGGIVAPVQAKTYEGVAARTHKPGDALQYPTGEEYRDLAELKSIVDQLNQTKPFLLLHPRDQKLLRDGGDGHHIGKVESARLDGDEAVVDVSVDDPTGAAAIRAGTHELSLGYACRLDSARYQRGTYVDHLALVPTARCGPQCSLRTDCGCGGGAPTDGDTVHASGEVACKCRARGHSESVAQENTDAKLTAAERHSLSAKQFAVPSREALPLEDEGHVRDAMARFSQEKFQGPAERRSAFHRIVARAHELGIDPSGFVKKYGGRLDDFEDGDAMESNMDELKKELEQARADLAAQKVRAEGAEKARDAEKTRADAAEKARDQFEVEAKNAKKDLDVEKTRADAAVKDRDAAIEKARTDAAGDFDGRVASKVALISEVAPFIGKNEKGEAVDLAKMSERDIKVALIKHADSEDVAAEKSMDFVNGLYAGAIKRAASSAASHAAVRAATNQMRQDGKAAVHADAADTEAAAMQSMNASYRRPARPAKA